MGDCWPKSEQYADWQADQRATKNFKHNYHVTVTVDKGIADSDCNKRVRRSVQRTREETMRIQNQTLTSTCRVGFLAIATALAGCAASGPTIVANSAPDFNVANYQTFSFMQPLGSDRGGARTLLSQHLVDATTRELEMQGLRHADTNGDLLVNFVVSTRETIWARPSSGASMQHHSRGRYNTWSGYGMHMSATELVQRTDGTIDVDIIDRARNQLVWEGAASDRVTDSTRRNLEETVHNAITDIFAEFP